MKILGNELYFSKVKPKAIIPNKTDENAGYDIYACFDEEYLEIKPHTTELIPSGIASAFSDDYYIQIQERGSTGALGIKYSAGVIDSSYRGEWFIAITNTNSKSVIITSLDKFEVAERFPNLDDFILYPKNKAIAQAIVHRVPKMDVKEISYEELREFKSIRGDGKLGSSGK
jgi:dUTP pyrophosphatase